jgi:hypothetical protein
MKKFIKNPSFFFLLSFIIIFSMVMPTTSFAATKAPKKWSYTYIGQPLFDPIPQKDGSLLTGSYDIVNGVYNTDIMTIDSKGKKKSSWKMPTSKTESPEILNGGTSTSPVMYKLTYGKGITYAYNSQGKTLWKKSLYLDYSPQVDQQGNLIFTSKGKLYKYSPAGKQLLSMTIPSYVSPWGEKSTFDSDNFHFLNSGEFFLLYSNSTKYPGRMIFYSATGKKLWETYILSKETDSKKLEDIYVLLTDKNKNSYLTFNYYDDDVEYSKIFAINSKGKILWKVKPKNMIDSSNGQVFNSSLIINENSTFISINSKGKILEKGLVPQSTRGEGYQEYIHNSSFDSAGNLFTISTIEATKKTYLTKFDSVGRQLFKRDLKFYDVDGEYGLTVIGKQLFLYSEYNGSEVKVYSLNGTLEWTQSNSGTDSFVSSFITDPNQKRIYIETSKWYEKSGETHYRTTISAY